MKKLKLLLSSEKGATAIEYGLILALIALALTVSLGNIGTAINNTLAKPAASVAIN